MNNNFIVGALIFGTIGVLTLFIWKAFMSVKYKEDARWKEVLTKARSFSSLTLWIIVLGWGALSSAYLGASAVFSVTSIKTAAMIALGLQCVMEFCAGLYFEKDLNNK